MSLLVESDGVPHLHEIVLVVLALVTALTLASVGKVALSILLRSKGALNRSRLTMVEDAKATRIEYWVTESVEGQQARSRAKNATGNNDSGTEAIVRHGANLIAHSFGLVLFCLLLTAINPQLIALLIAAEILGAMGLRYAQNYERQKRAAYVEVEYKRQIIAMHGTDYAFAKDIRIFNMKQWLLGSHLGLIAASKGLHTQMQNRYLWAGIARTCIAAVRDFFAYTFLTSQVLQGNLSVGDFTLQFAAVAGISNWLYLLAQDLVLVNHALRDIGWYREYLALPDTNTAPPDRDVAIAPPSGSFSVEFASVTFRYPGADVDTLRDFCLNIAPGERVALVGLNGAGKTTCVKLLTGLYRPTSGRILIDGIDSRLFSSQELFALFGAVFQESRLLATDIRQNVALKQEDEIDDERVINCLDLAGLHEKVANLEAGVKTQLTKTLYSEGVELSGGETQKLMLARALYKGTHFLVLDEPTAALDPIAEHEVYQSYADLSQGKSSLYISHRLASTRFCDRIALLENGQITELGSHDELLALGGSYTRLFELQSSYYQEAVQEAHGS